MMHPPRLVEPQFWSQNPHDKRWFRCLFRRRIYWRALVGVSVQERLDGKDHLGASGRFGATKLRAAAAGTEPAGVGLNQCFLDGAAFGIINTH